MKREQLEHLIRAAGSVSGSRRLIVVGSQSILSKYFAARDKGHEFCLAVVQARLADRGVLLERLAAMPIDAAARARIERRIDADFAE